MRFDLETTATPAQALSAFTDFTARRPEIWSSSLSTKTFEVRGQGEHWAEALESTPGSPFWIVSRYEWSDPTTVRWVVTECSYGGGGAGYAHISPDTNGGSRMHVEWTLDDPTRQRALLWLYRHAPMRPLIRRLWVSALDRYAAENAA